MISIITNINPDMSTKEAAEDTYFYLKLLTERCTLKVIVL